jgi:hypothetical protein
MGFLDDIFKDVKVFTDEIQSLKEELVSSVVDPTGELRNTVNEIAGEIVGTSSSQASSSSSDDTAKTDDTQSN